MAAKNGRWAPGAGTIQRANSCFSCGLAEQCILGKVSCIKLYLSLRTTKPNVAFETVSRRHAHLEGTTDLLLSCCPASHGLAGNDQPFEILVRSR